MYTYIHTHTHTCISIHIHIGVLGVWAAGGPTTSRKGRSETTSACLVLQAVCSRSPQLQKSIIFTARVPTLRFSTTLPFTRD